ncbi:MAG: fatty acid desaturase [Planctomycetes bacterium]|nr:fatty acid desaturase [Planctomycetota bacterium]
MAAAAMAVRIPEDLKRVDSARWCADLLLDWAVIALAMAGAIHAHHWVAWAAAVLVIGNRQHALGILAHDAAHYLAFRNRFANDLVSNACIAWLVMWSTEGYRWWHLKHHRHTGTPEDPELDLKRHGAPGWDLPTSAKRMLWETFLDFAGRGAMILFAGLVMFPPPKRWQRVMTVLWPLALSAALLALGHWEIVALWYLSAATAFAAFMRTRMWIEHVGTSGTHRVRLSRLEALLLAPHYTWLHWEHHHYPFVPCFHLECVRELDTSVPVVTLRELWASLLRAPKLKSGDVPPEKSQVPRTKTQMAGERVTEKTDSGGPRRRSGHSSSTRIQVPTLTE